MSNLVCNDCGTCCINVSAPRHIEPHSSCCYCGERVEVKIAPNQVIKAGTIIGELTDMPMTYKAFDPLATDGTQYARVVLEWDVCTDDAGRIKNWSGLWGCGPNTTQAYLCGKFSLRDINDGDIGIINAARASGMPIRIVNNIVYIG